VIDSHDRTRRSGAIITVAVAGGCTYVARDLTGTTIKLRRLKHKDWMTLGIRVIVRLIMHGTETEAP
jgi:hypothetical protein